MKQPQIFISNEIQVDYRLTQNDIQVNYKTTDLATKCQRKEKSSSVLKAKRPFRCWNLITPLEDHPTAVPSFRHFKNKNFVILWVETRNFEGRGPDGGIKTPSRRF